MPSLGKHKKEAIKLTALRSALTFLIKLISYPVNILIAAMLGPAMLGAVKILGLIRSYSGYNHLGLLNVLSRQVPIAEGAGDENEIKSIENNVFSAASITIVFAVVVLWGLFLSGFTFKGHLNLVRLIIISFTILATQADHYLHSYMKAHSHFALITRRNIWLSLITPFVTLALVWFLKVDGALLAQLLVSCVGIFFYCTGVKVRWPRWDLNVEKLQNYASIGVKVFLNKILNGVFATIDTTVIAVMLLPRDVGLYGFALGVVIGVTMVLDMFELMMHRHMLAERGKQGLDNGIGFLTRYLDNPTTGLILVATIFSVGIYFVSSIVVKLFIPQYTGALGCLYILSAGQVFYALSRVPSSCFNIIDWLGRRMVVVCLCLILNAIMDVVLIKMGYGIEGAAVASAGSLALYAVVLVVMLRAKVAGTLLDPLYFLGKIFSISAGVYCLVYLLDRRELITYSHCTEKVWKYGLGLCDTLVKLLLVISVLLSGYFMLFYKQKLHRDFHQGLRFLFEEVLKKVRA